MRFAASLVLVTCLTAAQTPAFDAASVKPSPAGQRGYSLPPPTHGTLTLKNVTLKQLVVEAYQIQEFQVTGGPTWFDSARYDVTARAATNVGKREVYQMLQALLADRFQLTIRRETRALPMYELALGKSGVKIHLSPDAGDCPDLQAQTRDHPCGGFSIRNRREVIGERVSMQQLADTLSFFVSRTVLDKTGLKGVFDVKLSWTPDEGQRRGQESPDAAATDETGPSIITALQEQAGLKLESKKGPVEVLVIDRAEKATEN
jgi:uncharacterized protein (TIGR03435 family)